jgi:hypothetical protein
VTTPLRKVTHTHVKIPTYYPMNCDCEPCRTWNQTQRVLASNVPPHYLLGSPGHAEYISASTWGSRSSRRYVSVPRHASRRCLTRLCQAHAQRGRAAERRALQGRQSEAPCLSKIRIQFKKHAQVLQICNSKLANQYPITKKKFHIRLLGAATPSQARSPEKKHPPNDDVGLQSGGKHLAP